jgi:hypothetical protein
MGIADPTMARAQFKWSAGQMGVAGGDPTKLNAMFDLAQVDLAQKKYKTEKQRLRDMETAMQKSFKPEALEAQRIKVKELESRAGLDPKRRRELEEAASIEGKEKLTKMGAGPATAVQGRRIIKEARAMSEAGRIAFETMSKLDDSMFNLAASAGEAASGGVQNLNDAMRELNNFTAEAGTRIKKAVVEMRTGAGFLGVMKTLMNEN